MGRRNRGARRLPLAHQQLLHPHRVADRRIHHRRGGDEHPGRDDGTGEPRPRRPVRRRRLHERVARHPPRGLVLAVGRGRHRSDGGGGGGTRARGTQGTRHLPGHGHHRVRHHRRAGGARPGRVHGRVHGRVQHPLSGHRRLHVLRPLAALPDRDAGRSVPVARQQPATLALGPGHACGARKLGGGGIARRLALPHGDDGIRPERGARRARRRAVRGPERLHRPQHLRLRPLHPDAAVRHPGGLGHGVGAAHRNCGAPRHSRAHRRLHPGAPRDLRGGHAGLPLLHAPGHRRLLRGAPPGADARHAPPARAGHRGPEGVDRRAPDAGRRRGAHRGRGGEQGVRRPRRPRRPDDGDSSGRHPQPHRTQRGGQDDAGQRAVGLLPAGIG